ncbi:MAG TPA: YtxH domain-containing protein [Bryobacteraceae bacterium]|nr:YtxH domain-containing protein [Bryobacteraceae bacterium]
MSERAHAEEATNGTGRAGTVLWFLTGAAVGVAVGVLYAPWSGREARERITGTSRDLYGRSLEFYSRGRGLVEDASELFERGRRLATRDIG